MGGRTIMKSVLYGLFRWLAVATAIAFLFLTGAGNDARNADPQKVFESVCLSADMTNLQPASNQMIKRLYDINPADYEFCMLYYPKTNMDVDELLLIKYADGSQEQQVKSAVDARLDEQKKAFENYGVNQMELLNDHSVFKSESGFAFFTVNVNADQSAEAFAHAIKED